MDIGSKGESTTAIIDLSKQLIQNSLQQNQTDKRIILSIYNTDSDKPGKLYIMQCLFCKKSFKLMGKLYNKGLGKYCSYYCAAKDRTFTEKTRLKMSKRLKGNKIRLGSKMSKEAKEKISKAQIGKHPTEETRKKLREWQIGDNNPNWKDGRTGLIILIRTLAKNNEFRNNIFKRDNYTCQNCNKRGGKLEAHHINPFSAILKSFIKEYNQFSIITDKKILVKLAIDYAPFWDINNGITLCQKCHNKTKLGRKYG